MGRNEQRGVSLIEALVGLLVLALGLLVDHAIAAAGRGENGEQEQDLSTHRVPQKRRVKPPGAIDAVRRSSR